ncbi:hypothetical protein ACFL0Q_05395, partial [Thermodesulfobacteriota bacterium]
IIARRKIFRFSGELDMLPIPPALEAQFVELLRNRTIPTESCRFYKKWLHCYLDFCDTYHFPAARRKRLPQFFGKLVEGRQTGAQRGQAAGAIALHHEIVDGKPPTRKLAMDQGSRPT